MAAWWHDVAHRYVACKIHQIHSQWDELKKANYIKHATREYTIQRSLHHPRLVRLLDVFEIDINAFCTVRPLPPLRRVLPPPLAFISHFCRIFSNQSPAFCLLAAAHAMHAAAVCHIPAMSTLSMCRISMASRHATPPARACVCLRHSIRLIVCSRP
eukprot:COSAG05_NODE_807_length_7192_cov_92.394191_3_plen_157_part_00